MDEGTGIISYIHNMNPEFNTPREIISEEDKNKYLELLWQKAEEYSARLAQIQSEQDNITREISDLKKGNINLHTQDLINKFEGQYWKLMTQINSLKEMEAELQVVIENTDSGQINKEELESFVSLEDEASKTGVSKKRLAIAKQREKYKKLLLSRGVTEDDIAFDPSLLNFGETNYSVIGARGPNESRLTTGRHQSGIKTGDVKLDLLNAEGEFFQRTADTHGGKVNFGKRDHYTSKAGKHIRKK